MANKRGPSEFEKAKQLGLIKDNSNNSVSEKVANATYLKRNDGTTLPRSLDTDPEQIKRTIYHNELKQGLNETSGDVVKYLKKERTIYEGDKINVNHHENSPVMPIRSHSISKSATTLSQKSKVSSVSSIDNNYETLRKTVSDYFNLIIAFFTRDEQIKLKERSKISPVFGTKQGILDFYNEGALQMDDKTLNTVQFFQEILNSYVGFSKKPVEKQRQEMGNFQNELSKKLSQIEALLKQQMLGKEQSDQFWSLYSVLNGTIVNFFKNHSDIVTKEDIVQLSQAAVTVNELLEQVNLCIKFAKLGDNPSSNIAKVEVIGIGSKRSKAFEIFAEKLGQGLRKITSVNPHEFRKFMSEYTKNKIEENAGKLYKEGTKKGQPITTSIKNILQATMNPSEGYGSESSISDIRIIITLKSGEVVVEDIDAKLGLNNRYIQSSNLKGTFNQYEREGDTNTNTKVFSSFLDLFIASMLTDYFFKQDYKKIRTKLKKVGTLFSLTSNNMVKKFGMDVTKMENSDLIVVSSQYMWFSDFLKLLKRYYIDRQEGTQSSVSQELITEIENQKFSELKLKGINDLTTLTNDNDFKMIVEDVTKRMRLAEVSFKVDIKDFFTK